MGTQEPSLGQSSVPWWTLNQRSNPLQTLSSGKFASVLLQRTKHYMTCRFLQQADRKGSLLQPATRQRHNSLSNHRSKQLLHGFLLALFLPALCTLQLKQTRDHSGGPGADSRCPPLCVWQLGPRLTGRWGGAQFSHRVKRLCQTCSPSGCAGSPSWSQSSPINDGPISSSCDLWAGKWKAWRCSHLYNQCQGASDMDTPHLPTPHQPPWSDGDA